MLVFAKEEKSIYTSPQAVTMAEMRYAPKMEISMGTVLIMPLGKECGYQEKARFLSQVAV
ncbi:MAG: hypothetical protein IIY71_02280 [Oscillospiraceae bacterium]|nr:hypothetical protein [Oscillospiraceae bacterium]